MRGTRSDKPEAKLLMTQTFLKLLSSLEACMWVASLHFTLKWAYCEFFEQNPVKVKDGVLLLTLPLDLGRLQIEFVEKILRILNIEYVSVFVYVDK